MHIFLCLDETINRYIDRIEKLFLVKVMIELWFNVSVLRTEGLDISSENI